MIGVLIVAAGAMAWRIRKGLFTSAEAVVLAVFAVNWLMIELQIVICDHRSCPEKRYWVQAGILLAGWAVWGAREIARTLSRRVSALTWTLPLIVCGFAVFELVMMLKPHIPFSRRHAHLVACAWAAERIRADWKGPRHDSESHYVDAEYVDGRRPRLFAHTARLPYVLGGRLASYLPPALVEVPDYLVDEEPVDFDDKELRGLRFERLEALDVGSRRFTIYRCLDGREKR